MWKVVREKEFLYKTPEILSRKTKGNSLNAYSAQRSFNEGSIFEDIPRMYTKTKMGSFATNALR